MQPPCALSTPASRRGAFTLLEVLTAISIMSVLTAMTLPALSSLRSAHAVTNSAEVIASSFQRARSYARTHNTYVWVGLREENANGAVGEAGVGRVVIAIGASRDGTRILSDGAASTPLPSDRITSIDKIVQLQNVHLAALAAPTSVSGQVDFQSRPVSDLALSSGSAQTPYPLVIAGQQFDQTIRFSPNGESCINGGTQVQRILEIGLQPTHRGAVDANSRNIAAVQLTGIGGQVQIFRN